MTVSFVADVSCISGQKIKIQETSSLPVVVIDGQGFSRAVKRGEIKKDTQYVIKYTNDVFALQGESEVHGMCFLYNEPPSEDEILDMMEDEPDGQLEEGEKRMIRGIFDLQDMAVKEIMTPRVDVVAIPLSSSIEEAKQIFVASGHSRIPVYGRSIDEIRGIIYAKDFLAIPQDKKSLAGMIHTPIFIPETKAVDELLEEIKRTRNHFAVIIDEYGGTSGIVTFEDIIEEIVGDVRDEYDSAEDAVEKPQLLPDGSVLLEARTPVSDVNEILDIDIPDSEHADTIGGYICAELGRIPEQGETYTAPGLFRAEIVKADKRKIQKLKLTVPENEDE